MLPNVFILGCNLKSLSIFSYCLFPPSPILIQDALVDPFKEGVGIGTEGFPYCAGSGSGEHSIG